MLEALLIIILLVVFAPLWIALIYGAGILLLYIIVFVVAGLVVALLIHWAGGEGWTVGIGGVVAAYFAVKGLFLLQTEGFQWQQPQPKEPPAPDKPLIERGPDGRFRRAQESSPNDNTLR